MFIASLFTLLITAEPTTETKPGCTQTKGFAPDVCWQKKKPPPPPSPPPADPEPPECIPYCDLSGQWCVSCGGVSPPHGQYFAETVLGLVCQVEEVDYLYLGNCEDVYRWACVDNLCTDSDGTIWRLTGDE